ncbi:TonB-dependent copper receptor [Wenzhouxiangella sediminis]|uniref:TonB-dependent copper receptor n=2 Tax=Wenzhouxiangella sediminis TaxID=1792836 RepID=A0A3E1K8W3_9GAMM|nr:TonB-dependent copper receptor [Wenzhouxiangella sediminis]
MLCLPAWAGEVPVAGAEEREEAASNEPTVAELLQARLALSPVVVTAPIMSDPYRVTTDPRQPRLPLPAHDGGSYLKSIPGFALSRKGGTSGDPALRGLGGSRLNILLDDATVLGGCGSRMDPPTAYVYPEAFDRIEVIKGPQSVRHGVAAAGVVRFDREDPAFEGPTQRGYFGATVGSFDRRDGTGEVLLGGQGGYARFIGTWSSRDDYRDGSGERIHSQYERWSGSLLAGWTPDEDTRVELGIERSDGEAAYDDRMMDGTRFDRSGYSLRIVRKDITPWLRELELLLFRNDVDHVMDNYTLRESPMMPMVRFPDRRTQGARLVGRLQPADDLVVHAGVDWMRNRHRDGMLRGPAVVRFDETPRADTARFTDAGAFVELERSLDDRRKTVWGVRIDRSSSRALLDGFGGAAAGQRQSGRQLSGFARYEHRLADQPLAFYAGLGRAERAPDYWERERLFDLGSEVLTQLDAGARYRGRRLSATLSLFYGKLDDYILIIAPGLEPAEARSVDATTFGAEADWRLALDERFSVGGSLAWVRSDNDSDGRPLAQTPPLEATFSVDYDDAHWFGGALLRAVARQDRIHPGYGTIYSLDTTPTPGFAVTSFYVGRHLAGRWTLTAGLDNVFDRRYAEHLQRGAAELGALAGRIPEPGRTAWLQLKGAFE